MHDMDTRCAWRYGHGGGCNMKAALDRTIHIVLCDDHRRFIYDAIDRANKEARRKRPPVPPPAEKLALRRAARAESVVYFVRRPGDGAIKIGTTTNLPKRLASFRHVTPIEVIGSFKGDRTDELEMHKRFEKDRIDGEWFIPTSSMLVFLDGAFDWKPPRGAYARKLVVMEYGGASP